MRKPAADARASVAETEPHVNGHASGADSLAVPALGSQSTPAPELHAAVSLEPNTPPAPDPHTSPAPDPPPPPAPDPPDLAKLVATLFPRFGEADLAVIRHAYAVAAAAHQGQTRASGEPYITHPVAVAQSLAGLGMDVDAIAAALLHDVVEDTGVTQAMITAEFGLDVSMLVSGVTKISALEAQDEASAAKSGAPRLRLESDAGAKAQADAENLRRMLLASVGDMRVILIKMADRLHNMQTLDALSAERRTRMARETLEIYAPLANRLGIAQLKFQFEDLALRQLEPDAYAAIDVALSGRRSEHETYLASVCRVLDAELKKAGLAADIQSRTKHIFSIYKKMERKDLGAEQIYDVLAVRVLVDEVPQCYLALGIVHSLWAPMHGEFDDYIAKRKNNLYQSLHTTVLGPGNRPLEVQIRTHNMHEVAEYGVAAHWMYKESDERARDMEHEVAALRRLLQSYNEDSTDAQSFIESLKTDVFREQVYVLTPKGAVMELPAGSTPIDFAYHIHTEVGHRCRGALVDGRLVALDTPLQTSQTVKIITAKGNVGPSRDWLNPELAYVVSHRARAKVRQWFRRQARGEAIAAGRDVLERQLRKLGLTRLSHDEVAKLFDFEKLDDFMAAVGRHDIAAEVIGARLLEAEAGDEVQRAPGGVGAARQAAAAAAAAVAAVAARPVHGSVAVMMRGSDAVQARAAQCCRPLPGDEVIGYVTRGKGMTLHRQDCRNIARTLEREPGRFIRVQWDQADDQSYPVELVITAMDRAGLVRDISEVLAKRNVNMSSISASANAADGTAVVTAHILLASRAHLMGVIDRISKIENVIEVRRPAG